MDNDIVASLKNAEQTVNSMPKWKLRFKIMWFWLFCWRPVTLYEFSKTQNKIINMLGRLAIITQQLQQQIQMMQLHMQGVDMARQANPNEENDDENKDMMFG